MEKTKKARLGGKLRGIRELLGVFGAFALIFVLLSVIPGVSEKFLAPSNLFNIARQITVNIVLACGLTMAILIGGIDLSVGSVIAISGCLVGGLMTNNGLPVYAAIAIGLASGAVFGAVNGLVISRTNIPPFIVTLATMYVGRGIVRLYTDSSTILITDDVFSYIGSGKLFGVVPIQIIYIVVLCLVTWFILNRTKFGRHIYAVGDNEQAALFTGINVRRVKLTVYVLVGLFAAIAGILNAARTSAGLYTSGEGYDGRHCGRRPRRHQHDGRRGPSGRLRNRRHDNRRPEQRHEPHGLQLRLAVRRQGRRAAHRGAHRLLQEKARPLIRAQEASK